MLTFALSVGKLLTSVWAWMVSKGHWKLVAAAMTAAIVILTYHSYQAAQRKVAALKEDLVVSRGEVVLLEAARSADSTALVTTVTEKQAIAQTEAEQRAKTDAALRANPVWANEPIPADVIRSLSM